MIKDFRWLGYAQAQYQAITPKTNYLGLAQYVGGLRLTRGMTREMGGVLFSTDRRMRSKSNSIAILRKAVS